MCKPNRREAYPQESEGNYLYRNTKTPVTKIDRLGFENPNLKNSFFPRRSSSNLYSTMTLSVKSGHF